MRFFISSNIKENRPLYYMILFFILLSFAYLISSIVDFYSKYGFSYSSAFIYFFSSIEYPEKPSLASIWENVHISLFLNSMFLLVNLSLFTLTKFPEKLKPLVVAILYILGLFSSLSDFMVYLMGPGFIYVKFFLFFSFTFLSFVLLTYIFMFFLFGEDKAPGVSILKKVIAFFALLSLVFTIINFFVFFSKMGASVDGVKEYYLGNPEMYKKPKTFEGMMKVFHPHIISIPLLTLTIAHLFVFTDKQKQAMLLGILTMLSGVLDSLLGFFIRYVWDDFALLKLATFLLFQLGMLYISLIVFIKSVR